MTYCCANPDCHNRFSINEAKRSEELIQLSANDSGKAAPWSVSVIHLLCPECNTIAASVHVPADPL